MTTKRIIYALALSALLSGWTTNGYAQTDTNNIRLSPPDAGAHSSSEPSLQGSWRVSFTAISGYTFQPFRQFAYVQPRPFRTLISFNSDCLLANALPSFYSEWRCEMVECAAPPIFQLTPSAGMGAWGKAVEGIYMFSYVQLLHDSDGQDRGELKVYATLFLNEGRQTFSGQFVTEILNETGQRILSYAGKITGQRLFVEGVPLDMTRP